MSGGLRMGHGGTGEAFRAICALCTTKTWRPLVDMSPAGAGRGDVASQEPEGKQHHQRQLRLHWRQCWLTLRSIAAGCYFLRSSPSLPAVSSPPRLALQDESHSGNGKWPVPTAKR